jgi:hypothetical protein
MTEESLSMRPFVQVAAICGAALNETNGFLSLIRIMDRLPIQNIQDEMPPTPLHSLFIVVILKSGEMRGQYKVRIVPVKPSGERLPAPEMNALFEGDERGIALIAPLTMVADEPGLYWFDVMVGPDLLTRIPLRIMYQKIPQMPGMQFPPQGD